MNKKPHLVADRIVDVNGRETTVYKRASAQQTNKSIPRMSPPSMTPATDIDRAVKALDPEGKVSYLAEMLEDYSPKTLNMLVEASQSGRDISVTNIDYWSNWGFSEKDIQLLLTYGDEIAEHDFDDSTSIEYIRALNEYPQFEDEEFEFIDTSDEKRQGFALVVRLGVVGQENEFNGVSGYNYRGRSKPYVKDEELVSLVMERPQDGDRIIDIIRDRGWSDRATMESLLDSDVAPSLSRGQL